MATANLIVKIGADISSLDRATKAAVNKIQGLASSLQQVGSTLAFGFTAPLAAFGAAALRSGGEIQSLKLALGQLEGSAAGAERRFKELLKVAELPGLGIREVVQADLSLRNYGFSAERAKKITLEFGNALAAAGRGKEDLAEATRQLGQLAARGKVTADNLKPIIERIPQAAQIIAKEFGTLDTEVLQKAGISSEKLITVLLDGLSKTGRVTGGIKNDFENLQQSVDVALAKSGEALEPFARKALEQFQKVIDKVAELGDSFKKLPNEQQNAIVLLGGIALATGPVVYGLGAMAGAITNIITLAGKLSNIEAIITGIGASLRGLPYVAAAAGAGYLLDKLNETKTAQENLTRANKEQTVWLNKVSKEYRAQQEALGYLVPGTNTVKDAVFAYAFTLKGAADETKKNTVAVKDFVKGVDDYKAKATRFGHVSLENAIWLERFGNAAQEAAHRGAELQKRLEQLFGAAAGEGVSIARLEFALNRLSLAGGPLEGIFTSFGQASKEAFQFTEEQITLATRASKDLVAEISKIPGETRLVEDAWARVGLQISQAVPRDLKDFQDRIVREASTTVAKGAKDFEKATKANERAAEAMKRHIERYMHQTARSMADVIFSAETIGQAFTKLGREILKSLATAVIEAQLKKLTKTLIDWGTSIANTGIGKVLGGLFGVDLAKGAGSLVIKNAAGAAGTAAGAAGQVAGAAGSAGSAAGSAASAASSGVAGIVSAVGSVVSAVSGVISNFQLAGVNKTLDLIEKEGRYSQIHLLNILENSNKFWPWIQYSHDRLRQLVETGIAVYNAAGDQGLRIAPGSGGGTTINFDLRGATFGGGTTQEAVEEMLSTAARRLVLAGGIAG